MESVSTLAKKEMLSPNLLFTKQLEHTDTLTHKQNYTPSPALVTNRMEAAAAATKNGATRLSGCEHFSEVIGGDRDGRTPYHARDNVPNLTHTLWNVWLGRMQFKKWEVVSGRSWACFYSNFFSPPAPSSLVEDVVF